MKGGTHWGMFYASTIYIEIYAFSVEELPISRKFDFRPHINGSNIDLGYKNVPPIASTRREQYAAFFFAKLYDA